MPRWRCGRWSGDAVELHHLGFAGDGVAGGELAAVDVGADFGGDLLIHRFPWAQRASTALGGQIAELRCSRNGDVGRLRSVRGVVTGSAGRSRRVCAGGAGGLGHDRLPSSWLWPWHPYALWGGAFIRASTCPADAGQSRRSSAYLLVSISG